MKLKVIGSSSSGNGYALVGDSESLLIEAGVPFFSAEKAIHFKLGDCAGVLVTHEHGDHARYIDEYAKHLPVYATKGTLAACNIMNGKNATIITPLEKQYKLGGFTVLAFPTQHDANESCGFLINHQEFGTLLFATDTYYLRYRFKSLNYIMIECNYSESILRSQEDALEIHPKVANRVRKSHMSLSNCIRMLQANDLSSVKRIVLIHLSHQNSRKQFFLDEVSKGTGKLVTIAEKGLEIDLW